MKPLYTKIALGIIVAGLAGGIVVLARTEKSIDLGLADENSGPKIQPISGSNEGLFRDTFNASDPENGVSVTESKVSEAAKSFDKRNLTDRISIDLFAKYLVLKNNGQEITPEVQEALVKNVIEENMQKIEYQSYSTANLKGISNPTIAQIREYGNTLATLIIENSPKKQAENELALLAKVADEGGNSESLAELKAIATAYRIVAEKLLAMTVPIDARANHIALAEIAGKIGVNISNFALFETDPASTISHVAAYDENVSTLNTVLHAISSYFAQKGIVYSTKEPGYAFTLIGQ